MTYEHSRRVPGAGAAFTLPELLVVISIIIILVVISLVGINRFRESARQTVCLGNLRQIGVAVLGYAGERGGNLPYMVTGEVDKPTTHSSIWQGDLAEYVPYPKTNPAGAGGGAVGPLADSVWFCPSAQKERGWWGTEPDYGAVERGSEAAGSVGVFSRNAWGSTVPAVRMAMIRQPERCLMVADACTSGSVRDGCWGLRARKENFNISAAVPQSGLAPRHGYNGKDSRTGRFGALFCDGHVEAFRYADPRLRDPQFIQALLVPY